MRIGLILIGDELLTGRRVDRHLPKVIEMLDVRGGELSWCRIVGDDAPLLTETLRQTFASDDLVFAFGGIGATPDDRTRQCAAMALGVSLVRHRQAAALLEGKFGEHAYPHRIKMADLPAGADLIPNPYNGVPGFSVNRHYFVPGFPEMAWPMVQWVLDTHYSAYWRERIRPVQHLLRVYGVAESELVALMEEVAGAFPDIKVSSLPHLAGPASYIEFGLRGASPSVTAAAELFERRLDEQGIRWSAPQGKRP
jgi:molybdopterin-biosynthesis enzyme MoeA-like protein